MQSLKTLQQKIVTSENKCSLTRKYLTDAIVAEYENVKTPNGGTLAACVQQNVEHPEWLLPRACDREAYETFPDFFTPVIKDYHNIKGDSISHPKSDLGGIVLSFNDFNERGDKVKSLRVRVARTIAGYGFVVSLSNEALLELEKKIASALQKLTGELEGKYTSLVDMKPEERAQLVKDRFLFKVEDHMLKEGGRGIFINKARNFLVWVNKEDHIRVISMQMGDDLAAVAKRLAEGVTQLSKLLNFVHSDRFGFVTYCPSNLGTTMRCSIHGRFPLLGSLPNFEQICNSFGIESRGTDGEHTAAVGGIYDLSNKRRLGLTEHDAIVEMHKGVSELLNLEALIAEYNKDAPPGVMPIEPLTYLNDLLKNASIEKCFTRKHLTSDIIRKYDGVRTKNGATLAHMVRNSAYNPRAICPRTGEAECYSKFVDYLDKIIRDYHAVKDPSFKHPQPNFGDVDNLPFGDLDPENKFIVSTRVRVGRSIKDFLFPTIMGKDERLKLEIKISDALKQMQGGFAGTYYPLTTMTETDRVQLVDEHFLFKNDDPVLRDAGGYRDWPVGRGIFHNKEKTFLVWVCEEDHMRIISMQKGGNLAAVYKRLIEGIRAIESKLDFAHSDKYGYLTCCPTNLGTTMRASVLLKIPKLSSQKAKLDEVCTQYSLQARGLYGEHTESPDGTFDISNRRRLGLTELQAAKEMADGVAKMIDIEKGL